MNFGDFPVKKTAFVTLSHNVTFFCIFQDRKIFMLYSGGVVSSLVTQIYSFQTNVQNPIIKEMLF